MALTTILVRPAPGKRSRALVQLGPVVVPAAIGRAGRTVLKREGDGATPVAAMKLLYGFRRAERRERLVHLPHPCAVDRVVRWIVPQGIDPGARAADHRAQAAKKTFNWPRPL